MENNIKVSYIDRLKSIYDKDQALHNAIIGADYEKFKSVTEKSPELIAQKHLRVYEVVKVVADNEWERGHTSELMNKYQALDSIGTDLKHLADFKYAQYWTKENGLDISNFKNVSSRELLREYLGNDEPSFKEPIMAYIKNDIEGIKELTAEKLDRKLDDLTLRNMGGRKISEDDKEAVIEFAKIEAIKANRLDLYQHLDKEFGVIKQSVKTDNPLRDQSYIMFNTGRDSELRKYFGQQVREHLKDNSLSSEQLLDTIDSSRIMTAKLNVVEETAKFKAAVESKNIEQVRATIVNGADEKALSSTSVKTLDPKDQLEIYRAVKDGLQERARLTPEHAKYALNESKNFALKVSYLQQDATGVYKAIMDGANPKALKEISTDHISKDQQVALRTAVVNAVNESSKSQSKDLGNSNSLNI